MLIKILNYVLAGLSFLIFLSLTATFSPCMKSLILKQWLGGERLENILSGIYSSDVFLKKTQDTGVLFDTASWVGRRLFKRPFARETRAVRKIARDDETVKDLKLVAVIRDGNAKAAIEDKKAASTFLVAVGDYCGDMKVAEIGKNEVVIEKDGVFYSLLM